MKIRKKHIWISIAAALALCLTAMTTAFLTRQLVTDNILTFGSLKLALHQTTLTTDDGEIPVSEDTPFNITSDNKVSRILRAENVGSHPMYVRIAVSMEGTTSQGDTFDADEMVSYELNEDDWLYRDGWYYYRQPLAPDETTEELMTQVIFTDIDAITQNYPGSRLGKSPAPLNTADRVGDGYVLLGWTLTAPTDPQMMPFHRVDHTSALTLVGENTKVNRPLELWPVYIKTVGVQSNIDAELTNDNQTLTDIRSLTVPSLNVASGTLAAQENVTVGADSYHVFVGWYTGYQSQDNPGEPVTDNPSLTLSGSELYADGVTYTAVYKTAYRITYHGDEPDEIVYTVMVSPSENRTFLTTVQVPGEDGTTTSVTVPVDSQAFTLAEDYLDNNQVFREWQYVPENGNPQSWDEFCNNAITQNMDLYPVALTVTVSAKDQTLETVYRGSSDASPINQEKLDVKIGLGSSQENGQAISNVSVLVMSEYKQDTLTVTVQENAYTPSGATSAPEPGIPVNLNLRRNADLSQSDSEASRLYGSRSTDSNGSAVFSLTGSFTITKIAEDSGNSDNSDTFLLRVTTGGSTQLLPIRSGGTVKISQIPYGRDWSVAEDEDWAWKYSGTVSLPQGQITSYNDLFSVTVTNIGTGAHWFNGAAYAHNIFGKGASGVNLLSAYTYTGENAGYDRY